MEMPKPNEHHQQLARLAGAWKGEETLSHSPMGPGETTTSTMTMRVDIDGLFLIQDYAQEKNGSVVYRGHGILGWDDQQKNVAWYWVDSMGFVPSAPSRGTWDGDTITLEHPPMGDRRGRYIYALEDANTLTFAIENSQDGGKTWHRFLAGKYQRN